MNLLSGRLAICIAVLSIENDVVAIAAGIDSRSSSYGSSCKNLVMLILLDLGL